MDKEMMKGNIDLILLSLIAERDLYGYEMTKKLKRLSDEAYSMSEGTLYPALKRMERKGWVTSYWSAPEGERRKKYYTMTNEGETELERKQKDWASLHSLLHKARKSYDT
ncbi:PadR family transcriptional regulator [Alkalibacillus salilacus]|uniref:DNA-binding PadR family transcriptional regulator n=1 Tax=Alkalibacillus salilacus TaxID=284582 RepID=A0ABT9VES2_9BACI|nr:PadR family transcriptional regulator [Alkalibacillus salilacus]MDQ0159472.1 DNA-binding PadR family transcriptional regulator [Alkalibacillus salilacus]